MSNTRPIGAALLLLGVLCALGSGGALAADRFTSTAGNDGGPNDCLTAATPCRTIAHTLTQAASGDTIKVAQGAYLEFDLTISASTTVVISGGWAADFGSQDPSPVKTKIDARFDGSPLLAISAVGTTIDATLDTLTFAKSSSFGIVATSSGTGSLTLALVNVVVRNNKGGGVTASAANTSSLSISLTNTTLKSNRTLFRGGGVSANALDSSALELIATGSTFTANWAQNGGGGIHFGGEVGSSANVSLDDCTFRGNRGHYPPEISGGHGGAMQVLSNGMLDLSIVNSTFAANRAETGAGINAGLTDGTFAVINSTFRRNMSTISAGAIDVAGPGPQTVTLRNTILWGNKAAGSENDLRAGGGLTVEADHCDIGDRAGLFTDLGGNIDADPRLSGDLHLRTGSPAIDAGTCTGAPAVDFEGDLRPAGAGCDMGVDEFVP